MYNQSIASNGSPKKLHEETADRSSLSLSAESKVAFRLFDTLDIAAEKEDEKQFWKNSASTTSASFTTPKLLSGSSAADKVEADSIKEQENGFWEQYSHLFSSTVSSSNVGSTKKPPETPRKGGSQKRTPHPMPSQLSPVKEYGVEEGEYYKLPSLSSSGRVPETPRKGQKRAGSSLYRQGTLENFESPFKVARNAVTMEKDAQLKSPVELFKQLYTSVKSTGKLMVRGEEATLLPFGKGSFMEAFTVSAEKQLVDQVPNSDLLLKMYHGEESGFKDHVMVQFLTNSLDNYFAAKSLGIPVAVIYNEETAVKDKYVLVQKIQYPVDIRNSEQVTRLGEIFTKSFKGKLLFDLTAVNLFAQKDGTVVLVDFLEKKTDFMNESKRAGFMMRVLDSWCSRINYTYPNASLQERIGLATELLDKLTNGLSENDGFKSEWKRASIDQIFIDPTANNG